VDKSSLLRATLVFALACLPGLANAATPSTVTMNPGDSPKTFTTLIGGSNPSDRSTCVIGVSCDTLHLVLAAGDYTAKQVTVQIDWLNPASDYDLYCFEGHVDGPNVGISNGGAPQNEELVPLTINKVLTAPRTIAIEIVSFAAGVENVTGTVKVVATPAPRVAHLSVGTDLAFCPNVTVTAPGSPRDCEPSIRVDVRGNCYVGGIRGVPAGVDVWRFDLDPTSSTYDPQLRVPVYLGQPDVFTSNDTLGGRDGGGDIDIATGFPTDGSTPALSIVSLAAANVSSASSLDRGNTFSQSHTASTIPADDRQWIEADGPNDVYMMYRGPIPGTSLFVQKSTDHGTTYGSPSLVSPTGTTPGYIDVDHSNGYVYVAHMGTTSLFVSRSTDGGVTWSTTTVDNSMSHGNLFDAVKVGDDGTVYTAWSDTHAIYLAHSLDHGVTWSPPVKVSGGESASALFPWLEAGSAGRVAIVWFGSSDPGDSDASDWHVYMALTTDATAYDPHVQLAEVSDHVVHASNISLGGLGVDTPATPQANRNLCDYFQVAIDPLGACVVAYSDDHNDYDGQTYVARQIAGTSLYASANGGSGVLVPQAPLPLPTPDPGDPQVSDFLHDATGGTSLQPIPGDNPYDILSIRYDCAVQGAAVQLETRMRVSALSPVPPNTYWRTLFSANAPGGVADRGDYFYLQATTDGASQPTFTFGSAVRDSNGDYTYTPLGAAEGELVTGSNEIVARVLLGALDPYVHHGPPVRPGSIVAGLRGATGAASGNSVGHDETRGGGTYVVCGEVLAVDPPDRRLEFGLSPPTPNPSRSAVSFDLTLPQAGWVDLSLFDLQGRRLRNLFGGVLGAGVTRMRWDGRTDGGHAAPSGGYYLRMAVGGQVRVQRLVLVR